MPRRRDTSDARGADQLQPAPAARRPWRPRPCSDSTASDALGVPGHRDRRGAVQVEALARQRADGGHLGEQDAGHRDRGGGQLLGGGQRLIGGQRADPLQRLEADRTHDDQFAGDRLQQQLGLTDQRR